MCDEREHVVNFQTRLSLFHMIGCLSGLIRGESMTIPQLVQIWINAEHMEGAIVSLESFIAKTTK